MFQLKWARSRSSLWVRKLRVAVLGVRVGLGFGPYWVVEAGRG